MAYSISFILFHLLFLLFQSAANGTYNIINYGAKPGLRTDASRSFLSAWTAACASTKPATILVPRGSYLLGHTVFKGPCRNTKIKIIIHGTFVAPSNYASLGPSGQWLHFNNVQGISIHGGILHGRGMSLWACKAARQDCPFGASSLTFNNAKDILISGLTSINSQLYHLVINRCQGVAVHGIKIMAPGDSPNTDGIHVQQSKDVTITSAAIRTGDDCISVGPGTMNLWVEYIACGPGHGISIGSLAKEKYEEGVQNVTVKNALFEGTQNGLRIKSWGRPSYGFVRGVVFQTAIMKNVQNPIIIDQNYCPHNNDCPGQHSGVKISDVKYHYIQGTSATQVAVKFDCSKSNPCKGIRLHNVKLTYQNHPAQSSCKHAHGRASGFVVPPSCL